MEAVADVYTNGTAGTAVAGTSQLHAGCNATVPGTTGQARQDMAQAGRGAANRSRTVLHLLLWCGAGKRDPTMPGAPEASGQGRAHDGPPAHGRDACGVPEAWITDDDHQAWATGVHEVD